MLLGITIDSNITFDKHINNICERESQKLNALVIVVPYMNMQKRRMIMKSFVMSQFGHCPLIWMFHSRRLNNKINSLWKTFKDHLSRSYIFISRTVKERHLLFNTSFKLERFATEIFKINRDLSPDILRKIFAPKLSSFNLRRNNTYERRQVYSVYHGTESLSFIGQKIWD